MQTPIEQPPLNELKSLLKSCGLDLGLLISGLFGAILLLSKNEIKNTSQAILGLVGGAASANYLTPLVIKVIKFEDGVNFEYGIAFLLGFLGLRGIEFLCSFKWLPSSPKEVMIQVNSEKDKKQHSEEETVHIVLDKNKH